MLAIYPNPKPCRAGFPTLGTAAACCGVLRMTVERLPYPRLALGLAGTVPAQSSRPSRAEKPRQRTVAISHLDLGGAAAQCQRGRIRLPINLAQWLAQATAPLREAPFTHEIVLAAQQLPLPLREPADRFLAATAQVMDLTLVTSDDLLLGLGTIRTMKN